MSKRPSQTLVLITPHEVVRADFAGPGRLMDVQRQPRPDFENFGMLVEAALLLGSKTARDVWVLSSELWMQTIDVIANLDGATRNEQMRALCLEAEQFSGISGLDSAVGFVPLPSGGGLRSFLVTQTRTEDLDEAEKAVHRFGGRLLGILHPAGAPLSLGGAADSWERIEYWPDLTLVLQAATGGKLRRLVVPGDPRQGRWCNDYQNWSNSTKVAVAESLAATASLAGDETPSLDDEKTLALWLAVWSRAVAAKERSFPCIVPPKRPMTVATQRGLMAVLLLAAIVFCGGHYLYCDYAIGKAKLDNEKAQLPSKTLASLDAQHKALVKEQGDLTAKKERLEHLVGDMTMQRARVYHMLAKFAEHRGTAMLLQKIDLEGGEPRVHGISLEPNQAGIFAKHIADALRVHGWQAQDLKSTALHKLTSGGPWVFEFKLRDNLSRLPASMAETKNPRGEIER
jgi:hypothetical protein